MNVTDAGAQVRPNTTTSTAPAAPATAKKEVGNTSFDPTSTPPAQADGFTQKGPVKQAPVALDAQAPVNLSDFAGKVVSFFSGGDNVRSNPDINVDRVKGATYGKVEGKPFIEGAGDGNSVHWNDIDQNSLGDCYLMAAMGEVAKANPDAIKNAIKDNGDGSYTVTFQEKKGDGPFGLFGHHYEPKEIRVTPDFPMQDGSPVFAGVGDRDGAQAELWPALIEKAYAQWQGSYHDI